MKYNDDDVDGGALQVHLNSSWQSAPLEVRTWMQQKMDMEEDNDHHLAYYADKGSHMKTATTTGTTDKDEPGPSSSNKRARTSLDAPAVRTQNDADMLATSLPPPPSHHHYHLHHHQHHDQHHQHHHDDEGHHQDEGKPSPSPSPNKDSSIGWVLLDYADDSWKFKTLQPAENIVDGGGIEASERREKEEEEEEEEEDLFARLPDSLLLKILDDVQDAKMIFRCSILCTRLRSLVWKVSALAFNSKVCCNMMMMSLVMGATELSSLHIQFMTEHPSRCKAGHTSLPPSLTVFKLDPSVIHSFYFGSSVDVWLLHCSRRLTNFSIHFPPGVSDSLLERILTVCVMHCHNLLSIFVNCGLALQQICSRALLECRPSESVRTLYLRGVFHLATTTPQVLISLDPLEAADESSTEDASTDRVDFLLRLFPHLEELELHPQDMRIPVVRSSSLERLVIVSGQFASNSQSTIAVRCQRLQHLRLENFADIDLQLHLEGSCGSGSTENSERAETGTLSIKSVAVQGLMSRVGGKCHTEESLRKLCNMQHFEVSSGSRNLRSFSAPTLKEALLDKETVLWLLQHSQSTLETCIWDIDIGCCDPYSTHGWSCGDADYHRHDGQTNVHREECNLNERPGEGGWGHGDGWGWANGWRGLWEDVDAGGHREGAQRNNRGGWGQLGDEGMGLLGARSGRIPVFRRPGDGPARRDGFAALGGYHGWDNEGWGDDGWVQEGRRTAGGWGGEDRNYDAFHRGRRDRRNLRGNRVNNRERRHGWGRQDDPNRYHEDYWNGWGGAQDVVSLVEDRDDHADRLRGGSNTAENRTYKFCKECSKLLWRDLTASVEMKALRRFEIRKPSVVRGWEDFIATSSAVGSGQESIGCPHGPSSSTSSSTSKSSTSKSSASASKTVEPSSSLAGFGFAPKMEVLKLFVDEITTRTLALIDRLSHDCTSLTTVTVKTRSPVVSTPIVSQLLNVQACPAINPKIVVENGW